MHGNAPGDTFDIIPEADFIGSTPVTVTVTGQANPADKTSTTFTRHVIPDKIFANGFNG